MATPSSPTMTSWGRRRLVLGCSSARGRWCGLGIILLPMPWFAAEMRPNDDEHLLDESVVDDSCDATVYNPRAQQPVPCECTVHVELCWVSVTACCWC